jgi:hypothetical protein
MGKRVEKAHGGDLGTQNRSIAYYRASIEVSAGFVTNGYGTCSPRRIFYKLKTAPSLHGFLFIAGVHASAEQNIFGIPLHGNAQNISAIIRFNDRRHRHITHTQVPTGTKFSPKTLINM